MKIKLHMPWGSGGGTLGLQVGKFYADTYPHYRGWGWLRFWSLRMFANTGRSKWRGRLLTPWSWRMVEDGNGCLPARFQPTLLGLVLRRLVRS